ncbi:MAG: hypothetical protein Q8L01_03655 [Candidatus Woesebacteria bacterium]|nr:hypothetical protein [Candidatus Woesebacteria bacterium]
MLLPKSATKILNEKFEQWRISGTTAEGYGEDGRIKKQYVDIDSGYYNSDAVIDYAVMIIVSYNDNEKGCLVSFLSQKTEYHYYEIELFGVFDAPSYVSTVTKGETVFKEKNIDETIPIILDRDAISFGYQEKPGIVYYFDGKKFITYLDSDGC